VSSCETCRHQHCEDVPYGGWTEYVYSCNLLDEDVLYPKAHYGCPGCAYEPKVTPERQAELDEMNADFEALVNRAAIEGETDGNSTTR
jgi:hypothetical protein